MAAKPVTGRNKPVKEPPPPRVKKTGVGLLDVAGEIRNRIYDYYFEEGLRVNMAAKSYQFGYDPRMVITLCTGGASPKGYKASRTKPAGRPMVLHNDRVLGWYRRLDGLDTKWASSLCGLALTCKQIYCEILPLLYANTAFAFAASARISNFVDTVPRANLINITRLHLQYATYGDNWSQHAPSRDRHTKSWSNACKTLASKLTNLEHLRFDIHATDHPLVFNLRQPWLAPVFQFRRLTQKRSKEVEAGVLCGPAATGAALLGCGDAADLVTVRIDDGERAQTVSRSYVASAGDALDRRGRKAQVEVQIHFSSHFSKARTWRCSLDAPAFLDVAQALHLRFAEAIRRRVLNWDEEDAIRDYRAAVDAEYVPRQRDMDWSFGPDQLQWG